LKAKSDEIGGKKRSPDQARASIILCAPRILIALIRL